MTGPSSADALLEFWKRQIEEGTRAWVQATSQARTADPLQVWRPFVDQGIAAWSAFMSQGPVGPDMLAQWKRFLDEWIAAWSKALEQAMGTEAFAQALGRHLEQWLSLQGPARQASAQAGEAWLSALGLPSRAAVAGLGRRMDDLGDRLEDVEDLLRAVAARLERLADQAGAGSAGEPSGAGRVEG